MALNIKIQLPDEPEAAQIKQDTVVPDSVPGVPNSHIAVILEKIKKILMAQGISCFDCPEITYKLLPLSDCGEVENYSGKSPGHDSHRFQLVLACREELFRFEIRLTATEKRGEEQ